MRIPRILICAGSSGSGKTLITCGILQALINRGIKPASFKCGPDYIDPMFHTRVLGTKSRNLDTFFVKEDVLRYLFVKNASDCDIAVMEGVMGYYDGLGGVSTDASTYDVQRATGTPAVLIVSGKGVSTSLAATVKGFMEFRSDSNIKGVIINHIKAGMYPVLKDLLEKECHVQVLGYVPEVPELVLESRHLGLVMPHEIHNLREKVMKLADVFAETIDLDRLIKLAETAPEIDEAQLAAADPVRPEMKCKKPVKIAVAHDEAFCFLYEDNLALLKALHAEIVEFSPIRDGKVPEEVNGLILYGGYPELFAKQLSENRSMIESIRKAYASGMPILAECGGFMYLHERMEDGQGTAYPQVGIVKGKAYKTDRLGRFGYVDLTENSGKFFQEYGDPGRIPAHEFHYYDSTCCGTDFHAQKPAGKRNWDCMISEENLLAGFPHLYYYGNPATAAAFMKKCEKYGERTECSSIMHRH